MVYLRRYAIVFHYVALALVHHDGLSDFSRQFLHDHSVVCHDFIDVLVHCFAHRSFEKACLFEHQLALFCRRIIFADLFPTLFERVHLGQKVFVACLIRGGSNDISHSLGTYGRHIFFEIRSSFSVLDFSRRARERGQRKQHEIKSRYRNVRRKSCALLPQRLFYGLAHNDVAGRNVESFVALRHISFKSSAVHERIARVQKTVAFLADVDESRLHAAYDVFHFALVDIAYNASEICAFNGKNFKVSVIDNSRARTIRRVVENELFHFDIFLKN